MKTVVVIGGGFAGLAAGVDLAAAGVRAIVLEGKPRLGGRAYSFTDQATGEVVDNGQHAMMGCYTHTLAFLDRIGATPKLHRQPNLRVDMIHARLGAVTIACSTLPGPLHMLSGILGYRLLQRRVEIRAGILNLTDNDYNLNPLTLYNELPRDRTFTASLRFNF